MIITDVFSFTRLWTSEQKLEKSACAYMCTWILSFHDYLKLDSLYILLTFLFQYCTDVCFPIPYNIIFLYFSNVKKKLSQKMHNFTIRINLFFNLAFLFRIFLSHCLSRFRFFFLLFYFFPYLFYVDTFYCCRWYPNSYEIDLDALPLYHIHWMYKS